MNDFTICLPSGIGDISWAYSKLKHLGPCQYEIADGFPARAREYMELLPGVLRAQYGQFSFDSILAFEQTHGWHNQGVTAREIFGKGFGKYYLEPNRHLEMGRLLADWLPDLATDYHYPIQIPGPFAERAHQKLAPFSRPITLVSCASYRGAEAWKTWKYPEWKTFLSLIKEEMDNQGTIIMVGGFWDDLTAMFEDDGYPCLVGKTHIATMIEMLKLADFYIGFSSGLGVLRTVLNKNSFMLWPDFQVALSTSWADPKDLEEDRYVAVLWREPEEIFKRWRTWFYKNPFVKEL